MLRLAEKLKIFHELTTYRRGLFVAGFGILLKSAGNLAPAGLTGITLTILGIIVFVVGLYMALWGMDKEFNSFH